MIKLWITVLPLAVLSMPFASTQQRVTLSELYNLAEENSQSIRTFRTAAESAREGVDAAKAQRLPDLGVSVSAGYLGDGLPRLRLSFTSQQQSHIAMACRGRYAAEAPQPQCPL